MFKIALGLGIGMIVGWLIRHYFKTPGFKSDTTLFFKRSGHNIKFYTTPTLIGTILVSISVLTVALDEVTGFMAIEEKGQVVNPRRFEIFRIKMMLAALTTWYAFINPAWQRAKQKQAESENTKPPMALG